MINVKSKSELEKMRKAGVITANALHYGGQSIKVGMSTYELDKLIQDYIVKNGAKPSSLGYCGFPGSACISINNEVIHGIPSKKKFIQDGDVVSIDVTALYDGYNGDTAYTFPVGNVPEETLRLLEVTKESMYLGIEQAVIGNRIGDIGHAVEEHCVSHGYGVVRQYIGHGMTITVEPMINAVGEDVKVLSDGWTVVTKSGSPAAHFEHTIAITPDGPVILTKPTIV